MNFFDKATKTVETMGKNVSKAAKDNMEIVKCSSAIDACEEKLKSFYEELGRKYYNAKEDVTRDAFAEMFEAIQANEREKEELKARLHMLKGVETCKKCGAEIKKGTKFCQWCGEPVEQKIENTGAECPNCHAPLQGTEKFCAVCGAKIGQMQSESQETENLRRCSGCGEILKETDVFCKYCGTPVPRPQMMKTADEVEDVKEAEFTDESEGAEEK
ncbi:MAG: zinc ribbon domain-containing protein [Lachnospiraceae bacterium]|nr:zinc ribbon domain-containing protein [Lachnospiraceae bacterium]